MTDPRPLRSREALILAMTDALDAGADAPSITDLCVSAGVSRPTFYQHFGDVPALAAAAALARVDALFAILPPPPAGADAWRTSVSAVVTQLLAGLDEHREFYRRVLAGPGAYPFHEQVIGYLTERLLVASPIADLAADTGDTSDTTDTADDHLARQTATFLAAGSTWLLTRWALEDAPAHSSSELASQVAALLVAGVLTLRH